MSMYKFWQIGWHEYARHVFRKRFIFAVLSVPFFLLIMVGLVILVIAMNSNSTPIGYIDQSGLLINSIPQPPVKWPERTIQMQSYPDESSAMADLEAGKLQVYYIVPSDYLQTGKVEQVYLKEPKGINTQQFDEFLKANLLSSQPPEIASRLLDGSKVVFLSADKSRQSQQDQVLSFVLPFVAGILFIIAISISSGYLMQAVVEEKENRTMEIMVTSVSPNQLMGGKILADIAVGITQLVVWAVFIALVLIIGKNYIPALNGISFSGGMILVLIAVMLPGFVMISGLMAAVGATVTEASEGQQVMGLFTIPIWIPYFFISLFLENPNSPLAIALSLFPLTAPMSIAMRIGVTSVPSWQIITSIILLTLSAIGSIWLAGKAFRIGMLRYGQRVRLKEVFSRGRL